MRFSNTASRPWRRCKRMRLGRHDAGETSSLTSAPSTRTGDGGNDGDEGADGGGADDCGTSALLRRSDARGRASTKVPASATRLAEGAAVARCKASALSSEDIADASVLLLLRRRRRRFCIRSDARDAGRDSRARCRAVRRRLRSSSPSDSSLSVSHTSSSLTSLSKGNSASKSSAAAASTRASASRSRRLSSLSTSSFSRRSMRLNSSHDISGGLSASRGLSQPLMNVSSGMSTWNLPRSLRRNASRSSSTRE